MIQQQKTKHQRVKRFPLVAQTPLASIPTWCGLKLTACASCGMKQQAVKLYFAYCVVKIPKFLEKRSLKPIRFISHQILSHQTRRVFFTQSAKMISHIHFVGALPIAIAIHCRKHLFCERNLDYCSKITFVSNTN